MFDTIFTSIGSATKYLKVYNKNKSDIKISSVKLAGENSSKYRINVDGLATNHARDLILRAHDSIFIFVEVTINPTEENSLLQIHASIIFETNGNTQDVKLIAWGQNVTLLKSEVLNSNTIFTAEKPYLIIDSLWVLPGVELTINPGARLHFHNMALLKVAGTLTVKGEQTNPVVFEGDRLESFYRDKAGQWGGIWLRAGSHSSVINWAEIKNAIFGIIIDTVGQPNTTTLKIHNSKILNMSSVGLYARGAHLEAGNCLFANAGEIAVALAFGGKYQFYHCTIANYWGQYTSRKGPSLLLNNYYTYKLSTSGPTLIEPRDMEQAYFGNCIIYGSRTDELEVDDNYKGQVVNAAMNYFFENTTLRVGENFNLLDETRYRNVANINPKFKNPFKLNFELDTLSPAKDIGLLNIATMFPIDLNGNSRLIDLGPDIGAFERQEKVTRK
jgi:hypothetical protein